MKIVAEEYQIKLIINQIQNCIESKKFQLLKNREINKDFIREIGWTPTQVIEFISENLVFTDYVSGPEQDHNNPQGTVWKFGKIVEYREVYIKVSLINEGMVCISFHQSKHPLQYIY